MAIMLFSATALASDIPIDNHIEYDRGDIAYGGENFIVDRMVVNWDNNDQVTVDIYTNFGGYNNSEHPDSQDSRAIIYGDLLLGTTGSESDFNYAFSLGELTSLYNGSDYGWSDYYGNVKTENHERYFKHAEDTTSNYSTGGLYAINNTINSNEYHPYGGVRDGEVFGDIIDRNDKAATGNWGVKNSSSDFDVFSFSFNVATIEAFQNADQLALSWTMSCYNDAVTALITKTKGSVPVPTPTSSVLILLGLALLYSKKRNNNVKNDFLA